MSLGVCGIVCLLVACLLAWGVWSSTCMITLLRMRGPLVEVWLVHWGCSASVVGLLRLYWPFSLVLSVVAIVAKRGMW